MKYWYYIYFHSGIYEEVWSDTPINLSPALGDNTVYLNTLRGSKWSTHLDKVYKELQPFMKIPNGVTRQDIRESLIEEILK